MLLLAPAGAEGKLRSFAGPGHGTAEDGGVLHQVSSCAACWLAPSLSAARTAFQYCSSMPQGSTEGDTITVYPSKIDPHCEALMFVISASDTDVTTMNLDTPDTLHFSGFSAGKPASHHCMSCPLCPKRLQGYCLQEAPDQLALFCQDWSGNGQIQSLLHFSQRFTHQSSIVLICSHLLDLSAVSQHQILTFFCCHDQS